MNDQPQHDAAITEELPLPSQQELLELIKRIPEPICLMDTKGRIILVNHSFCEHAGICEADIIGKPIDYGVREGIHDRAIMYDALRTGEAVSGVVHIKGGRNVLTRCIPLRDAQGQICFFLSISVLLAELNTLWDSLQEERRNNAEYQKEIVRLRKELFFGGNGAPLVSLPMQNLWSDMRKCAQVDCVVLISGETGVGKDVVAKAVHLHSKRNSGPFVAVNVPTLPEYLLESELFGYESGAFTGAKRGGKRGLFEEAQAGTLFLDEIGDMPLAMQVKILRTLENGEIRRVGGATPIQCNARILAATNKNLAQMVKEGSFREDLYYRLNVMSLHVSPLRERVDDIKPLVHHFLEQFSSKYGAIKTISFEAIRLLTRQPWPGNVRDLRNTLERLAVLTDTACIEEQDVAAMLRSTLPVQQKPCLGTPAQSVSIEKSDPNTSIADEYQFFERERILDALKMARGNKSKAAHMLGMSRSRLYNELGKH